MRRIKGVLLLLFALMAFGSCVTMTTPAAEEMVYIYNAKRLHAEGWWREIYVAVEACAAEVFELPAGRSYDDLEFYMVAKGAMLQPSGDVWGGVFSRPNRIFIDELYIMDPYILGHEMLHYITGLGHGSALWALTHDKCLLA